MTDTSAGPNRTDTTPQPPQAPRRRQPPPMQAPAPPQPMAKGPIGKARSTGLTILLAVVTFGLWTFVWSYANGEELKNYNRRGVGGPLYVLLLFFFSPIVLFLLANEVELMYRRENQHPPITTLWGLWFLLPLIGNIIWYVRMQRALNDFWIARGSAPASGVI